MNGYDGERGRVASQTTRRYMNGRELEFHNEQDIAKQATFLFTYVYRLTSK